MVSLLRRRPNDLPGFVSAYLDAPSPSKRLPWRQIDYCVLDVETGGLNPRRDPLLSIGLIEVHAGRVQLARQWYTLIQPRAGSSIAVESIRVHGLLPEELAAAPVAEEALRRLLLLLRERVLVVHVASIDIGFLNQALAHSFGIQLRGPAIDTARLAATLHQNERYVSGNDTTLPGLSLRGLALQAGLPEYDQHNALSDALTTAQLFIIQATQLEQQGYTTLGSLLRAGGCL